jgi:type IV pilus assembly protein PilF
LKVAQEIDNDSAELHEILALTLEKMGDEEKVEPEFKKALRLDSSYTRARVNYGSYLMRQSRYEDAFKQFKIVADDVYYQNRSMGYEQLAICAEKLNKPDEAIKAYQKALALDSRSIIALMALAQNAYAEKNYPAANQYLKAYRSVAKPASAASLLLGIKIARQFADKGEEASYAIVLKNLYPRSQEYLDYLKMQDM